LARYFDRIVASQSPIKKRQHLELVKDLTQYELTVDSALAAHIERPGTYEEQKKFFSGKKKIILERISCFTTEKI